MNQKQFREPGAKQTIFEGRQGHRAHMLSLIDLFASNNMWQELCLMKTETKKRSFILWNMENKKKAQ